MVISDTLLLLCLTSLSHGLGSLNSLFGDKGSSDSSASNNNMILCTVRHSVHYARVYDTVLVNKVENGPMNPQRKILHFSVIQQLQAPVEKEVHVEHKRNALQKLRLFVQINKRERILTILF